MNAKSIATLMATIVFATVAYAGEQNHHKMEIQIVADDGSGASYLTLNSDELGYDLHDMLVGENRSIVTEDGQSILVTRGEESFSLDIDGKTVEIPAFDGRGHADGMVWAGAVPLADDTAVHVMHDFIAPEVAFEDDAVMIFSGKEIDSATKELIRTTLESAGHQNVQFADGDVGVPLGGHVVTGSIKMEVPE